MINPDFFGQKPFHVQKLYLGGNSLEGRALAAGIVAAR
jgi:hypothetical protein